MIKNILLIIAALVVLAVVALVLGPCVYYNFIDELGNNTLDMPEVDKASHEVYIENTGGLFLTSDYEVKGTKAGSRIITLHGYWEMRGDKFKYIDMVVPLDEGIFGRITITKRLRK